MSEMSRRDVLRGGAAALLGAAGAGLAGARAAAQVTGLTPDGGVTPFRPQPGLLPTLDPKQYIHNMEIHAFLPNTPLGVGNDGETCPMWARGAQRMLLSGIDITDPKKPFQAHKPGLGGGCLNYSARLKKWIVMESAMVMPTSPTPRFPRGGFDEEYAARNENAVKFRGIRMYDVTDLSKPNLLSEFSTGDKGNGTHANFWDGGRYAYLDCNWDHSLRMDHPGRPFSQALMIVDVSDPSKVKEVARWWVPGQKFGEEAEYYKYPWANDHASWTCNHGGAMVPTRVEDGGTIGYCGMGRFGLFILDLSDPSKPRPIGRVTHPLEAEGAIPYHSTYPIDAGPEYPHLNNLVITVPEPTQSDCREPWHTGYVIDVKDKRNPKIIGLFPRPVPPPEAPYTDFCFARGRMGPHNTQPWIAPGAPKPNFVAITEFSAGLQIFDISDPTDPKIAAYFVPGRRGDINKWETWWRSDVSIFVEYDRNLIWLSDNPCNPGGGIYCLSTPLLGKPVLEPRKVTRWTLPHHNAGWDDQVPKSVYLGRSVSQLA